MNVEIHVFEPKFADDLRLLYLDSRRQAFHWLATDAYKLSDFDQATQDEEIRVALYQGKPVGFIAWYVPDNFIHHLFLAWNYQKKGIGKALLLACLAELEGPCRLKCFQQNDRALGFYHSQGWQFEAEGHSADGPYYLLRLDNV